MSIFISDNAIYRVYLPRELFRRTEFFILEA
jgi:hypothetical protein